RPGEPVHAKAIIRRGQLGALTPAAGDSLHWVFTDREGGAMLDRTVALSEFGTSDIRLTLPAGLPLGQYQVRVEVRWRGEWKPVATAGYRVAEYRPPEFLVSVSGDTGSKYAGGRFGATVEARYLFGAPMGRAALDYTARLQFINGWELGIPGTDGYSVGNQSWWWEDDAPSGPPSQVLLSGKDTLDPAGRFSLVVPLPEDLQGRPARATLDVVVRDVNRQAVGAAASALVHPASFYLAARPAGDAYFWNAGKPVRVQVLAVRPDGSRVPGVDVRAVIVRREWHRVHRERAGMAEQVGEWVMDTVARCRIATAMEPAECGFTPPGGGVYQVSLTATDSRGRIARTSFNRWATGPDWVPWNDESQFKMDVVADRDRYSVGDTATVLFAAPFTDAEAWITVEREGILEQRRLRITSGSTTLRFPITEAFAPNAFVSIVLVRGRSAPPGPLDDPGRPTLRVGYAELRVTPEIKRLAVEVAPIRPEYRPGDTVQVRLRVRDTNGHGHRSEVTLWAVDEGVLALTGYRTPDPLDLLYRERGLGVRLASNLVAVAPQVPEGEKGGRNPGGGGGEGAADVLRSRFQTTAFFLGSVVTDSQGTALARARLPDNITTFRVMAVAVTAGDRYGSGESPLLVTRPLVARPALPRFLRAGDRFTAGVVVNQRAGGTPVVDVTAAATGAALSGAASRQAVLDAGRGKEIRFGFLALPGDSAAFRFDVRGAGDADAVRSRLVMQPAYHPRAHTISGVLVDTASVSFALPQGIDPARSRLVLSLGASPLGIIRGAWERLRVYPYYCSEQVASTALPLIALYRAGRRLGDSTIAPRNATRDIDLAVATLSRRQRADGGIGYWSSGDWSSPWLSAHAGLVLLEARAAGAAVDDSVIARLGRYLEDNIHNVRSIYTPVSWWYDKRQVVLAEQLAAADLLSRLGRPDVATENELLRQAAQMAWVDRPRLVEVLARRADRGPATALLASVLADVHIEGRRAVLPDSTGSHDFYFSSAVRPAAQLLTAVLATDSANPVIGPLVETLVDQGRGVRGYWWNTQDFGSAVYALAVFERRQQAGAARGVEIRAGRRLLLRADRMAGTRDSSIALTGLVQGPGSRPALPLALTAGPGSAPVYFYLTVLEAPLERPVNPDINGITVERWYESYPDGKPVTEVSEGDLVRVRLRLTTPSTRYFVVLDDALPAGLEAIDLSLRTAAAPGVGLNAPETPAEAEGRDGGGYSWAFGRWDSGWWSPFDHREIRDDRVVYMATVLWKGSYTATYVARATTPGVFVKPPAWAEEMYNPAVNGRSEGGSFTVNRQE
ncbi:MAG: alpha-2-macroglobulin, partial [Gemmatimonadales bacterium]